MTDLRCHCHHPECDPQKRPAAAHQPGRHWALARTAHLALLFLRTTQVVIAR